MDLGIRSQSDHVKLWLQDLESENYDPKTLYGYAQRVRRFETFMQGVPWEAVRPRDLTRFKLYLKLTVGLCPRSVNQTISTLRVFFSWLHWNEVVPTNYLASMKGMRTEKPLPRPFEEEELNRILAVAGRRGPFPRAWIETQYSTGCRVMEVMTLTWGDVHLVEGYASVVGKGARERNVPLGRFAIEALRGWKAHLEGMGIDTGFSASVWTGPYGGRITYKKISKMLKATARQAGVEGDITTHRLRHSFATHMLNRGEDIRVIQELLGHASIMSTQIYTKVASARMLEAFKRAHPRA